MKQWMISIIVTFCMICTALATFVGVGMFLEKYGHIVAGIIVIGGLVTLIGIAFYYMARGVRGWLFGDG